MTGGDRVARIGPSIEVVYSCIGCVFLEQTEERDPAYLCTESTVVEEYDAPQRIGTSRGRSPSWCPYLRGRP